MYVTGTQFNYFLVCHRKLWLFANGINMEHVSDLVYEGRLIHENSYKQRSSKYKEIELDGIKIDFYDSKNKIIHETKKSRKEHESQVWQLKYYIFRLMEAGVDGVIGLLEYPAERKIEEVCLSSVDISFIEEAKIKIYEIIKSAKCPKVINSSKCKKCSYFDFCYTIE